MINNKCPTIGDNLNQQSLQVTENERSKQARRRCSGGSHIGVESKHSASAVVAEPKPLPESVDALSSLYQILYSIIIHPNYCCVLFMFYVGNFIIFHLESFFFNY